MTIHSHISRPIAETERFLSEWRSPHATLEVCTSGSTGEPKRMRIEKSRMRASAIATCEFLNIPRGATALLCLPTRYIAGKMMVVRSEIWGLQLWHVAPSNHPYATLTEAPYFAALTPSQVYASLQVEHERRLMLSTPCLLIGGGAISAELEDILLQSSGQVWSSYGMTETLSHIALRRIGTEGYEPLPGVSVGSTADGCLWIDAPSVCTSRLTTNDLVSILPNGRFCILGRRDNTINTGGIKIQLETLEEQHIGLEALTPHRDYLYTWVHDEQWGQALTLLLTPSATERLQDAVPDVPYLKHILTTPHIPLTPTGKPAREEAHLMAEKLLHP